MLRITEQLNTEDKISKKEESARSAESRKSIAENEFLQIAKDKKRLLIELKDTEDTIKNNESKIEDKKKELTNIKIECNCIEDEIKELNNKKILAKTELGAIKDQIKADNHDREIKLKVINTEISNLKKSNQDTEESSSKKIKELNTLINTLSTAIEDLLNKKSIIVDKINTQNKILTDIVEKVSINEKILDNLNKSIPVLESDISKLEKTIKTNTGIIEEQKVDILGRNLALTSLKDNIAKKEAEYIELERKAFTIANRPDLLDQREAFIKAHYERAGIKYE